MSGLLGGQLPMFAIAALVLAVAVIAAVFVVRRSGKGARGEGGTRGRQAPRLAMVDSTPIIDGRKLVIVRRDDVEHLVLIGGVTDVLIEANIRHSESVDAIPAEPRESMPRMMPAEISPRVAAAEAPSAAPEAKEISVAEGARLAPETPVRPVLAEPPAIEPISARVPAAEPVRAVLDEPAPSLAAEPAKEQPAGVPMDHFAELAAALQRPSTSDIKAPPARPAAAAADSDDQNLSDMAHRLEAALRRPVSASGPGFVSMRSEPRRPFAASGGSQRLNPTVDLPRVPPRIAGESRGASEPRLVPEPRVMVEPRVSSEPKGNTNEDKPAFESLEREMASLLGRSPR
jgi:hypothetical protein